MCVSKVAGNIKVLAWKKERKIHISSAEKIYNKLRKKSNTSTNIKKWVPTVISLFKYYIHEYCVHFFRRNFHFVPFYPPAFFCLFILILSFLILYIPLLPSISYYANFSNIRFVPLAIFFHSSTHKMLEFFSPFFRMACNVMSLIMLHL